MRDKIIKIISYMWDDRNGILIVFGILIALILGYGSPLILWAFGGEQWGIFSWEFWLAFWGWFLYIITFLVTWMCFVLFGGTSDDW